MRRRALQCAALVGLAIAAVSARAAEERHLPIWPEHTAADVGRGEDVSTRETTGDMRWIKNVTVPTLNVFLPPADRATGVAVVICPGGGYAVEAYDKEGTEVARWLVEQGIAGFILKYRLPDGTLEPGEISLSLQDARRAIQLVRARAADFGVDPGKIGIMGFSAGGHLTANAGTYYTAGDPEAEDPVARMSSRPDFFAPIYPVVSMVSGVTHLNSKRNLMGDKPDPRVAWQYSPELQVTPETPPPFLVHCADDSLVPAENSVQLYLAAVRAGLPAEMHLYPHGGHGFGVDPARGIAVTWTDRFIEWLGEIEMLEK